MPVVLFIAGLVGTIGFTCALALLWWLFLLPFKRRKGDIWDMSDFGGAWVLITWIVSGLSFVGTISTEPWAFAWNLLLGLMWASLNVFVFMFLVWAVTPQLVAYYSKEPFDNVRAQLGYIGRRASFLDHLTFLPAYGYWPYVGFFSAWLHMSFASVEYCLKDGRSYLAFWNCWPWNLLL